MVRITPAHALDTERTHYLDWVEAGRQGEMRWITPQHADRSAQPQCVLPGARSVICVGMRYWTQPRPVPKANSGRIARYAWGGDYHVVLGERLKEFCAALRDEAGAEHRWYVDTGPLMDKALAARAGLGWYGKNTNILTPEVGSWVLLGEIVTTLHLEPDARLERSCGSCRLCLIACPTGALGPEYSIDSRKCISYLTIEHRGPIPLDYRPLMGSWVFGCDICQDVCPPSMQPFLQDSEDRRAWSTEVKTYLRRREPEAWYTEPETQSVAGPLQDRPVRASVDLVWLLGLSHEQYLEAFRGTSIRRAKVWMLRRNAAVALGNVGTEEVMPALLHTLQRDEHPVVRSHAAWAIGRLAHRGVRVVPELELRAALSTEEDKDVRREIESALKSVPALPSV